MTALIGERVLLGVTGGIAAYKSAELTRRLKQAGADVRVVMSRSAEQFITQTTLQALSGNPVRTSLWDTDAEAAMSHIELARWASKVVVAPASADFIARLAAGQAGDLLSTLCLATTAPIYLAPAMNQAMWANAASAANRNLLLQRGVQLLGPASGEQACGEVGEGRMLEPIDIVSALSGVTGALTGKKFLISAGPSFEDIDPVRFIGNRSSGKMGFALAEAASEQGADVVLVAGPVSLATPRGVRRLDVRSAQQMFDAVMAELPGVDVFIASAAVADYRPKQVSARKIKKTDCTLSLDLERTADILTAVSTAPDRPELVVGFAAETERLDEYAQQKLLAKNLDFIAANDVSDPAIGFESERNALTVFSRGGGRHVIAPDTKRQVAVALLALINKPPKERT
ncbi:MAG TPA: bifunctional phosphopantothenoylcysteine decarboxylase/phosphopantothenate--cysteine ligase CoaBC [Arenimonas sp.]|nr:bifunctional phosphopantothenoylcysteine decarboxylase/phosphopantothenate--cysteine ligase CoaBC [Arenimonas sp.]